MMTVFEIFESFDTESSSAERQGVAELFLLRPRVGGVLRVGCVNCELCIVNCELTFAGLLFEK